jgi:hypothetical protein
MRWRSAWENERLRLQVGFRSDLRQNEKVLNQTRPEIVLILTRLGFQTGRSWKDSRPRVNSKSRQSKLQNVFYA